MTKAEAASMLGAATQPRSIKVRKILAPVDFSDDAAVALDWAVFLGLTFDAVIEALHVWEPPVSPPHLESQAGAPITHATVVQMSREASAEQLEALMQQLPPGARQRVVPHLQLGHAPQTIVEMAREGGFDLIVMGTRGRTGLKRLVLGSVAEKVVRHAPCPVVTVPLAGVEDEQERA